MGAKLIDSIVLTVITVLAFHISTSLNEEVCESNDSLCQKNHKIKARHVDVGDVMLELKRSLKGVRASCGEICETREGRERVKKAKSLWGPELAKEVDCGALFSNPDLDLPSRLVRPVMKIPKFLLDDYTYQGRVPVQGQYLDDSTTPNDGRTADKASDVWTKSEIDELVEHFRQSDQPFKWYGQEDIENIKRNVKKLEEYVEGGVEGKHVLVVGTKLPWLESILLLYGASKITTLEYAEIRSEHPKVEVMTPWKMSDMFLEGTLPKFDIMVTFSSVEHSGLGRYGDRLNPFGDLITMARSWCLLKPGGLGVVGIPVHSKERIVFNANRVYGPVQLPHLFANWEQLHTDMHPAKMHDECHWCYQPLFILRKPNKDT